MVGVPTDGPFGWLETKLPPKPSKSGSQNLHSFQFRDAMPVAMEELVEELGAAFDARFSLKQSHNSKQNC